MNNSAHRSPNPDGGIPRPDLARHAEDWLLDGEIRQLSKRTLEARRFLTDKLLWFLDDRKRDACGLSELRLFLAYLNRGHESESGRWGNPKMKKAVKPRTVQTYYTNLRTFFGFIAAEGHLDHNPVESIKLPVSRGDQIRPFSLEQVEAILGAAKKTKYPLRDTAIVLFLFDTGARASELCALQCADLDVKERRVQVLGKGNKKRTLPFGKATQTALWAYLKEEAHEADDPLFFAERGHDLGENLTRSGLRQLVRRLGKYAGIEKARCSPHTFRHTFAVSYLRNGGDAFSLKELLGHTSLTITNRCVAVAEADIENKHRLFSPTDHLKQRKRGN